jgi:hypothetical protein
MTSTYRRRNADDNRQLIDTDVSTSKNNGSRRRAVRIDDVLWFVVFLLTMWYFDVVGAIWFDRRIDWYV